MRSPIKQLKKNPWLIFLVLHFLLVGSYLLTNEFESKQGRNKIGLYVQPFFAQSWRMFAPPPQGDQELIFNFLCYSNGQCDTLRQNATEPLRNAFKKNGSTLDRVSYFLSQEIVELAELNNRFVKKYAEYPILKENPKLFFKLYQEVMAKSVHFKNLVSYSEKCFTVIDNKHRLQNSDSTLVMITILTKEFKRFDKRFYDLKKPYKNYAFWNLPPQRIK